MTKRPLACGIGPAFEVVGGKWKAVILWELNTEVRRFGELRRLVPGISEKMLIQQLRELEADGLVKRQVFHEVPPRVEYSATKLGTSLNVTVHRLHRRTRASTQTPGSRALLGRALRDF